MGSVSICRDAVAAIGLSQALNTCNNVRSASSRRVSRGLSNSLPRGLADCSSQSSLYVNRSESLKFACRGGGANWVKLDGRGGRIVCANKGSDDGSRPQYSADAKMRSEVIAPFRALRMFFYSAFMASGSIGGLIALTRLIASLNNAPGAEAPIEIAKGLAIDFGAVAVFALLYRSDAKARDKALAKIGREENLSNLRLELSNKKVVTIGQLRGTSRIVILAGPASYIEDALRQSEPYKKDLLERGVLVAAYATDGATIRENSPAPIPSTTPLSDTGDSTELSKSVAAVADLEKKWRATPIYTSEWGRWINDQKELANVSSDQPVYVSLRLDGRVRGSGVGIPSWQAMARQLPPTKGIWGGVFDGMDGRV
ncbi:hypothetical protein KC19_1G091300 [Ceratodon purpureus]|uniref:Uncharacterized protein n=1 Tax=Ceratodon purpureus TaxID=3225 RepID=A0A8T0J404_CERPU|nr:hypothetical protein KC19_1G091300 [Ceratodon purpureus]